MRACADDWELQPSVPFETADPHVCSGFDSAGQLKLGDNWRGTDLPVLP